MPGMVSNLDPGTAAAVASPPLRVTSGSASPCTTRNGMVTPCRPSVRSGEPRMAPSWRAVPSGQYERSYAAAARSRRMRSSVGYPGRTDDQTPLDAGLDRLLPAGRHRSQQRGHRLTGGRADGAVPGRRHDGAGALRKRSGWLMTRAWVIMPPMETPTTCARAMPSSAEERGGIVRHVLNPVGRRGEVGAGEEGRDVGQSFELGGQPAVAVVERITKKPRWTESVDEALRPGRELGAQAHDEEQRRIRGITLGDVLDLDPVDVGLRHGRLPSARLLAEFLPGGRTQRVIPSAGQPSRPRRRPG
jgi:hypothetical protein